jgi:hypothetical protein
MLVGLWWIAVRERELEILLDELLDVWTAQVLGLLHLDNLEDLNVRNQYQSRLYAVLVDEMLTWIVLNRARCLDAISWYMA